MAKRHSGDGGGQNRPGLELRRATVVTVEPVFARLLPVVAWLVFLHAVAWSCSRGDVGTDSSPLRRERVAI
jgi:hypothetical protein